MQRLYLIKTIAEKRRGLRCNVTPTTRLIIHQITPLGDEELGRG